MKTVLCISAHPDDDTLFAGTLLKLKRKGWKIYEAILTGGEGGVSIQSDITDLKEHRAREAEEFAQMIGIEKVFWLDGPDGFLRATKKLTENLVKIIRDVRPSIVILLSEDDYHTDHRESQSIALNALELANRHAYENLGEAISLPLILLSDGLNLHSHPDIIVNTSLDHEKRIQALKKAYASQMDQDLERFSEGVALARGARIKVDYGEGFVLGKLFSRTMLTEKNIQVLQDLLGD